MECDERDLQPMTEVRMSVGATSAKREPIRRRTAQRATDRWDDATFVAARTIKCWIVQRNVRAREAIQEGEDQRVVTGDVGTAPEAGVVARVAVAAARTTDDDPLQRAGPAASPTLEMTAAHDQTITVVTTVAIDQRTPVFL
eukprot:TRINITY_DN10969_c0_g2_i2.p1 TRINITY_DN10969_c0_g2~~TRINITY_DN10969_c0_g2_i2.p1  ORF type:complete len:142 (-),score=13.48 TRINITY_DN10969_c0_g2_i2:29-454(-)